jgi:hypothetical protein
LEKPRSRRAPRKPLGLIKVHFVEKRFRLFFNKMLGFVWKYALFAPLPPLDAPGFKKPGGGGLELSFTTSLCMGLGRMRALGGAFELQVGAPVIVFALG